MSDALTEIQAVLTAKADKKNIAFFTMMIPGKQKIYGVKTPVLNELVKQYQSFSFDLAEELWESGAQEEKVIAIKIMEKMGKTNPGRLLKLFKKFSKQIDNWAVCDGLGMQFLRAVVKTHEREIFTLAENYSLSKDPWQKRLSLVMLEWYTRKGEHHAAIKKVVKRLENDEEYYVKKAVVWIKKNFARGK